MITVHGRTRNQMFKGKADWNFILKSEKSCKYSSCCKWRYKRNK